MSESSRSKIWDNGQRMSFYRGQFGHYGIKSEKTMVFTMFFELS